MRHFKLFIGLLLFPVIALSQSYHSYGEWNTSLTPMPESRFIFSTVTYNDSIYIIGGIHNEGSGNEYVSSVDVYHPATDTWNVGVTELPFPRGCPNVCLLDNKIYVIGGLKLGETIDLYDSLHIYDLQSGTWSTGQCLPTNLGGGGSDTLDGKIYIAGGGTEGYNIVTNLYVYDPDLDEWTEKAQMNVSRRGTNAQSWNSKLYVFGGYTGANWAVTRTFEVYDPDLDEWTQLEHALTPGCVNDMTLYKDQMYVVGGIHGWSGSNYHYTDYISRYDPSSEVWLDFPHEEDYIPAQRQWVESAWLNDSLFLFGGSYDGITQDNVWVYTLKNIRQNMTLQDTTLASGSYEVDLAPYFSIEGDGELNFSVCPGYDEELINPSIEGSVLSIDILQQGGQSTAMAVNVCNAEDTITSNSFSMVLPNALNNYKEQLVSLYPNPASASVLVSLDGRQTGRARLEIYSSTGQLVEYLNIDFMTGDVAEFELNVEGYSNGLYLILLKSRTSTSVCKLLIEK